MSEERKLMDTMMNKVFWVSDKVWSFRKFDYPELKNVVHIEVCAYVDGYCFPDIRSHMIDSTCRRYAIVLDMKDERIKSAIKKRFVSNNIVDISSSYDKEKVKRELEWILSDFGREYASDDVFMTSDTHFWHANICKYCNRPWNSGTDNDGNLIVTDSDVIQMNEELIKRWNSVVKPNDVVWHLGDFALGPNQTQHIPELVSRLNGKIRLVLGNHDHHSIEFYYRAGFSRVYDRPVIIDDSIILSHAPVQWVNDDSVYSNLYGHVHNQKLHANVTKNTYNCCVEVNDYMPVRLSEIKRRCNECK